MKLLKVNRYQVKKILSIQLLIFLTFTSFETRPESLVREFSGSQSTTTSEFEVKAPWILDWRINSNYQGEHGIRNFTGRCKNRIYGRKNFQDKVRR